MTLKFSHFVSDLFIAIMIFFLKQPATALIRQSCGEQRIKRASYATYTSTFPPNDSFWQSELSSIRRDVCKCMYMYVYILLLRFVGWVAGIVGWGEQACSQSGPAFLFENHLYLPRLKTVTQPKYEKKEKNLGSRLVLFPLLDAIWFKPLAWPISVYLCER